MNVRWRQCFPIRSPVLKILDNIIDNMKHNLLTITLSRSFHVFFYSTKSTLKTLLRCCRRPLRNLSSPVPNSPYLLVLPQAGASCFELSTRVQLAPSSSHRCNSQVSATCEPITILDFYDYTYIGWYSSSRNSSYKLRNNEYITCYVWWIAEWALMWLSIFRNKSSSSSGLAADSHSCIAVAVAVSIE